MFFFYTCTEATFLGIVAISEYLLRRNLVLLTLLSLAAVLSLCSSVYLAVRLVRALSVQDTDRTVVIQSSESFFSMRRKLQRDLHDGFGPTITAAKLHVEAAHRLLDDHPDVAAELLSQANTEIGFALGQMRQLIRHLHVATEVPAQGLDQAIKALGEQFQQTTSAPLKVSVDCPPLDLQATNEVHEELYFIAREAITNVVRHATATQCLVKLYTSRSGITLTVRDDGAGLPKCPVYGIGLRSMQERAAEQGGTCAIFTHPAGGVQVEAFLPWKL